MLCEVTIDMMKIFANCCKIADEIEELEMLIQDDDSNSDERDVIDSYEDCEIKLNDEIRQVKVYGKVEGARWV
jgi:hypothetical protein